MSKIVDFINKCLFFYATPSLSHKSSRQGLQLTKVDRIDLVTHKKFPTTSFCFCLLLLSLLYFRHYWLLFWSKYIQYILLQRVLCEKQHICRGIGQVITVQFVGPKVGSFENHQQNMRKITKNKCNSIGNCVKELLVASSSIFVQIKPFLQGNQKRQI